MLHFLTPPWRTVVIGTGYAARQRTRTLLSDPRVKLIGFVGRESAGSDTFAAEFGIGRGDAGLLAGADLVFVTTVNRDHGLWVRRALEAGAHVVVEYPLALDLEEARALVQLARETNRLLHVEHMELLSGIHQAIAGQLGAVGTVHFARYANVNARAPEPDRWTYSTELFGFPLVGALSRLSRIIDLVAPGGAGTPGIKSVFCQNRYFDLSGDRYRGCLCVAQLEFASGAVGEVIYAKGAGCYRSETRLELAGSSGLLVHEGEVLRLFDGQQERTFAPGDRKGLFDRDTRLVLDVLSGQGELYISAERSLAILAVAAACERSAHTGQAEPVPPA